MASSEQHFRKSTAITLSCEISGALHLVQPGLTAGRLKDEIQVKFEIFKIGCRRVFASFITEIQHHYSLTNAFQQGFFQIKPIARLIFQAQNF